MPVKSTSNAASIVEALDRQIATEIGRVADEVLRNVQDRYRETKSGRVYRIGKTPTRADRAAKRRFRSHRASAPGEAPAIDTGALRKGTTRTPAQKVAALRWVVTLGITAQSGRGTPVSGGRSIAEILEFGGSRIKPRPAWRPALGWLRARYASMKR